MAVGVGQYPEICPPKHDGSPHNNHQLKIGSVITEPDTTQAAAYKQLNGQSKAFENEIDIAAKLDFLIQNDYLDDKRLGHERSQ